MNSYNKEPLKTKYQPESNALHPQKITKKNNVYILKTADSRYVVKPHPQIDYRKLYNYLYSRNFNYLPKIIDTRDDALTLEYIEELSLDNNQKALDLINLVSLLHTKTSYFKNITNDKYKEIYDNIKNNLDYTNNLYDNMFNTFIEEEYILPSHYLFLRNYSLIYNALNYSQEHLDIWFNKVKSKNEERVALIHNNLNLDHIIKNQDAYLISWDRYTFDTPVLDLYNLYQHEWANCEFKSVFDQYNRSFPLLEEERLLLDLLISMPYAITFTNNEYLNTRTVRQLINYLGKSSKIVLANTNPDN